MRISIAPGQSGLTVYGFIRDEATGLIFNGTSMVTWNASNWATYAVALIEQTGSGYYSASFPSGLPPSTYSVVLYQQAGGSPVSTDNELGTLSQLISPTPAPLVASVNLIESLRIAGEDAETSNRAFNESPVGAVNGTNTHFRLANRNIVPGSVLISDSTGVWRENAAAYGFVEDDVNGMITFNTAPVLNTILTADYYWQWFTDTDMSEFINEAAQNLGYTDPTAVPQLQVTSLLKYALNVLLLRKAQAYTRKFSSSSGGISQEVAAVANQFQEEAKQAFDEGVKLMNNYYTRSGARQAPASGTTTYKVDPFTPAH